MAKLELLEKEGEEWILVFTWRDENGKERGVKFAMTDEELADVVNQINTAQFYNT